MEKDIPHIDKLTPKQRKFCQEYLVDLNATQAAVRAGYSLKTARITACKLLTNPNIQAYINKQKQIRAKTTAITAQSVLKRINKLADTAKKDTDKVKALELLGKHLGLFTDKLEHSGEVSHHINIVNFARRKK